MAPPSQTEAPQDAPHDDMIADGGGPAHSHGLAQDEPRANADKQAAPEISEEHSEAWYRDKKIRAVKRAARSELSVSKGEWRKHGWAESNILSTAGLQDDIPRVHWRDLSVEEFVRRFEQPRLPVVITGLTEGWGAAQHWTPEQLLERFGDHKFKVGSDDDGYAVRLKFRWFLEYMCHPDHGRVDDSPLYIFDGSFGDRSGSATMLKDYTLPPYFNEDLFQHVGEKRRPPYRWVVIGPARSGSGLHIDPLATSAWNALLTGHKRWALFPPGTPKQLVLPKEPGLEREACSWFSHIYPRAKSDPDWPAARPIDLIQGPGETVFVPGGWWHAVLNLDLTVAVTQNYASTSNFDKVWRHTRKGRPKMSVRWLDALSRVRPDLAQVAHEINQTEPVAASTSSSSSSSSSSSGSSSSSSSSDSSDDEQGGRGRERAGGAGGGGGGEAGGGGGGGRSGSSHWKKARVEPGGPQVPEHVQQTRNTPSDGLQDPLLASHPGLPATTLDNSDTCPWTHQPGQQQFRPSTLDTRDPAGTLDAQDHANTLDNAAGQQPVAAFTADADAWRPATHPSLPAPTSTPTPTPTLASTPALASTLAPSFVPTLDSAVDRTLDQAFGNSSSPSAPPLVLQASLRGVGRGGHSGAHTAAAGQHPVREVHEGMPLAHGGQQQLSNQAASCQKAGVPLYVGWCNHLELRALHEADGV